jgi:protein TonB
VGDSIKRRLIVIAAALIVSWSGLATGKSQDQSSPPAATPAPTQQDVPKRVSVAAGVMRSFQIRKVNPTYPEKARRKRIQGTVTMNAIIDQGGNVASLQLVSGDPILAKAATEVVKQWKYRPYLLDGHAVEVETVLQVNFALSN